MPGKLVVHGGLKGSKNFLVYLKRSRWDAKDVKNRMKNIFPTLSYDFFENCDSPVDTLREKPLNCDTEKSQKVHSVGQLIC